MAEPFLAEIRLMSFVFAPKGWALCNGQLLPINQNQALFSLLGTTFGGNGQTTFALPDLRGRTPIHVDAWHSLGQSGGAAAHTLSVSELPQHTHRVAVSTAATGGTAIPADAFLGGGNNAYRPGPASTTLHPRRSAPSAAPRPTRTCSPS
ncbi:phage tail protein [Nocardioides humi]|uniref:phage tail protein n=1 Tax=Nocardioides humi TaxID=449461 RepID=UPI001C63F731|nr:tail fiber protein [Nocardioides humi]